MSQTLLRLEQSAAVLCQVQPAVSSDPSNKSAGFTLNS